MKIVKSSCSSKRKVRTCTFSPQVNIKNKRTAIQTEQDVNAAHSEAKIQDLIDEIRSNIYTKVKAVATSPDFGFDENEVDDYFFVEASATEIGEDHHEAIRVEVRAEVSYEGLEALMEALNPIIETYDSYAYFEPVEPGIIEAYASVDQVDMSIYGSDDEVVASGNSEYTNRYVTKYKNKSYTVYDNSNSANLPQDADIEALQKWKAQVTQQSGAYNDADREYQWAKIENGVIYYYRNGKLEDKSYYMSPSDWDIEQLSEWSETVINEAIENLYEANKNAPDRMIHNSTSVQAATDELIDLSILSDSFVRAYTAAVEDFLHAYQYADAQVLLIDDPNSDKNEVCAKICGIDSKGKRVCGKVYFDKDEEYYEQFYQAFDETAEVIGMELGSDELESSQSIEADTFSSLEDQYLSPPEYDDLIENEDSQELIEVEIDQVITVDVDGDYEWDDDTYVWASPDGSNEEWRSEDGVYIDDKVGVVEHIDDLIIPNVPTRPGKYRVTGLAQLIYDVSGIQEYRKNYGPDDYESDLDTDHAVVAFNFSQSTVENLKITPVRR